MKLLRHFLKKQRQMAKKQMKAFAKSGHIEDLHQLRVTLKKIRTVYQFMKNQDHSKKIRLKYKSKFRPFFTDAGNIRKLQLFRKKLKAYRLQKLSEHSPSLKNEAVSTSIFQLQLPSKVKFIEQLIDRMESETKHTPSANVFQYGELLKMNVYKSINKPVNNEWHAIRKEIKRLLHMFHFIGNTQQLRLLTVSQFKDLDRLQETIGHWHDLLDFHEWLITEGFSMSGIVAVKKEFKKAWSLIQLELRDSETKVVAMMFKVSKHKPVEKNK
jgi:CHAD domain-containing protein